MFLLIMYVYNVLAFIISNNLISGNERCACKIFFCAPTPADILRGINCLLQRLKGCYLGDSLKL